jgi:putative endonuclease
MTARYFVYILANATRGVLYVGLTNDLIRRLIQHRSKAVRAFTRDYGLYRLVSFEEYSSLLEAKAREHALKRWRRTWKFQLIESANPEWRDLSEELVHL